MSSTRLYRPSCLDQWVEGVLHGLKMGFIWGAVEGTYYRGQPGFATPFQVCGGLVRNVKTFTLIMSTFNGSKCAVNFARGADEDDTVSYVVGGMCAALTVPEFRPEGWARSAPVSFAMVGFLGGSMYMFSKYFEARCDEGKRGYFKGT